MNCRGRSPGEPLLDGVDRIDCGLRPPGVESAKEGKAELRSGVLRTDGVPVSESSFLRRLAELIHFSSLEPKPGESGRTRKTSAK
jgi:hypothetical protein